jgi:pyrimidine operon attenuation protein / uracil phosphoribosyltransferase
MSTLHLDAEALYAELRRGVTTLLSPDTALVGIWSGGAWLAERLHADLQRPGQPGVISSTLHRDDFSERGMSSSAGTTHLPFEIDGRDILLIDDVLYTGRTIRAALDGLVDLGRPKRVQLAVLIDRGHRELPIQADYVGKYVQTADDEIVEVRMKEEDEEERVVLVKNPTFKAGA